MRSFLLTPAILMFLTATSVFAQQADDQKQIIKDIAPQYNYLMEQKANTYGLRAKVAVSDNEYVYVPVSFVVGDGIKQYFAGLGIGELEIKKHISLSLEAALAATTFDARYQHSGTHINPLLNTTFTANLSNRLALAGHLNMDLAAAYQMFVDRPSEKAIQSDVSGAGLSLRFKIGSLKKK